VVEAFFWGAFASSSLVLGALVVLNLRISHRMIGLVMGFGAGVLISAVAFELFAEATASVENRYSAPTGLFAGSLTFFAGDALIDRLGGEGRKSMVGRQAGGVALAIVLGIVLDGVPESFVVGMGLVDGGGVSAAFVVAVFLSNLPEAAAASSGLRDSGWRASRIYLLWVAVSVVAGLASAIGYDVFSDASGDTVAFVLAFAAGAILTMLADTMIPEAFEQGGKAVGLLTTLGFAVAFAVGTLD
jgi:zinc transporter, ZIP family